MSDAKEEQSKKPADDAEQTPPPEPGEFGKRLEKEGVAVQHLGPDAMGTEMIAFEAGKALDGARVLRDNCQFDLLVYCAGVDWKDRLESVYQLYSTETDKKLIFKVIAENEHSPSMMPVWPAADWHERETYDLYGIQYDGHPNLERILMPNDWLGHPLRKDYKVDDPRLVWNER